MSTVSLIRRLEKLESASIFDKRDEAGDRIYAAIREPGVMARLQQIVDDGEGAADREWLDRKALETGVDFQAVVTAMKELHEEY